MQLQFFSDFITNICLDEQRYRSFCPSPYPKKLCTHYQSRLGFCWPAVLKITIKNTFQR